MRPEPGIAKAPQRPAPGAPLIAGSAITEIAESAVYWLLRTFLRIFVVDAYGAAGDGTTDDSAAFAAARDAIGSSFGIIFLLNKTYAVKTTSTYTGALRLTSERVFLLGAPGATMLAASDSAVGIRLIDSSASHGLIAGVTFDPNGTTDATCIYLRDTSWVLVTLCLFLSPKSGGVHIGDAVFNLGVVLNRFSGAGWGILWHEQATGSRYLVALNWFLGGAEGDGIEFNAPTNSVTWILVVANVIQDYTSTETNQGFGAGFARVGYTVIAFNIGTNCTRNLVHVEDSSFYVLVFGNLALSTGHAGIEVQSLTGDSAYGVALVANLCLGCCVSPSLSLGNGGIEVGAGAAALYGGNAQLVLVLGNLSLHTASGKAGIYTYDARYCVLALNLIANSGGPGLETTNLTNSMVLGNALIDFQGTQTYGITAVGSGQNSFYALNFPVGNVSGALSSSLSPNATWRHNLGAKSEASGTATVANGSTTVAVNHGLSFTPALKDIQVTPTNSLGNAAKYWIASPTSTQFTIAVNADPGATTATFAWQAHIL